MAEYMSKQVAGMDIPEKIINRMKSAPAKTAPGRNKIAIET